MAGKRAHPEADELALLCAKARNALAKAGRSLHDDIGPLLAGAGLWLSMAEQNASIKEAQGALEQAMERVRALSQALNPSPADRLGLRNALLGLREQYPALEVHYSSGIRLNREDAALIYDVVLAVIQAAAAARAERIRVDCSGDSGLRIRVTDDGRPAGRARTLAVTLRLAQAAGISVSLTTGKSTIVLINHALRRSVGG